MTGTIPKLALTLLATLLAPLAALHAADAPPKQPNIIVILAKDWPLFTEKLASFESKAQR